MASTIKVDEILDSQGNQFDGSQLGNVGKVLQVKTAILSDKIATTATRGQGTYTLFNVPITPVSSTSKLHITGVIYYNGSQNWNGGVSCEKIGGGNSGFINSVGTISNSTVENALNFFNSDDGNGANDNNLSSLAFNLVTDSGTTGATSIQVKLRGGMATNQTIYINRTIANISSAVSTITVMEIGE